MRDIKLDGAGKLHCAQAAISSFSKSHLPAMIDEWNKQTERLHVFLGPVWAEQLIIALNRIALKNPRPFLDLLRETADYVVEHSNHFEKPLPPSGRIPFTLGGPPPRMMSATEIDELAADPFSLFEQAAKDFSAATRAYPEPFRRLP